ncbi:MAG: 50S ribosomal protein L29 [Candidatus Nomurabacteria bacterium]|jgi:ribosomal protein L29|nr:50S ribosomal protein L29 [Candidatus Nomurabacteria bacterium]
MADKKTTPTSRVSLSQKLTDWRAKDLSELNKILASAKADLLAAQKSLAANELANPKAVNKMRKEIARLKTIIAAKVKAENNKSEEK